MRRKNNSLSQRLHFNQCDNHVHVNCLDAKHMTKRAAEFLPSSVHTPSLKRGEGKSNGVCCKGARVFFESLGSEAGPRNVSEVINTVS